MESTSYEISSRHTKIHFQIFAKRMWYINWIAIIVKLLTLARRKDN